MFVATAKISDDEMRGKIERHREERPDNGSRLRSRCSWLKYLRSIKSSCDVMVVDCLTIFAANLLESEGGQPLTAE